MTEYYNNLEQQEQEKLTEVIRLLYRQTFLLERKFDKRTGRSVYQEEYRTCYNHLDFLKEYFSIAGISLRENAQMGVISLQDETIWGEKLSRTATIYLLVLKLLYDERMATASSSSQIVATFGEVTAKAGEFHVLRGLPSPTEMRRTISFLKKYQIVEPLDVLEELNEKTRLVIYPCINEVLTGDDIRQLLNTFNEEETSEESTAVQGNIEDLSE